MPSIPGRDLTAWSSNVVYREATAFLEHVREGIDGVELGQFEHVGAADLAPAVVLGVERVLGTGGGLLPLALVGVDVDRIGIARSQLGGLEGDVGEDSSGLVHRRDEAGAGQRLAVGVGPRVLLGPGDDVVDREV